MFKAGRAETLGDIYTECGHIYVTSQRYVHMHFYVSEKMVADYIARKLSARIQPHRQVFDVVISKRKTLAAACRQLLKYSYDEERKRVLVMALDYCVEEDRRRRQGIALRLREFLRDIKTTDISDETNL